MTILKKDIIAEEALNLFLRLGTQVVSMDDIANRCGMSKRTLYKEFDSKTDLLHYTYRKELDRFNKGISCIQNNSESALEELLNFSILLGNVFSTISPIVVNDLRKYYNNIYLDILDFKSKVISPFLRKNINNGIKENLYRNSLPIEEFEDSFTTILGFILKNNYPNNTTSKYNRLLEFAFYLFISGLQSSADFKKQN